MRIALLLATLFFVCGALLILAHAQEIEVTVTNTTVWVWFKDVVVYTYNATVVRIGWVGKDILRVVYVCVFSENYDAECTPMTIVVYDPSNTSNSYEIDFDNLTEICYPEKSYCNAWSDINVSTFSAINVSVYRADTGEKLEEFSIPKISIELKTPDILKDLAYFIPIALLICLAGRGSMKLVSIGLIVYGVVLLCLPFIGITNEMTFVAFVISTIFGAVLMFFSRE